MKNKLNLLLKLDVKEDPLPSNYLFFIENDVLYVAPSNPNIKKWVTDIKEFKLEYEDYLSTKGDDEKIAKLISKEIIPNVSNLISDASSITIESSDYEKIKRYIKQFNISKDKKK